MTHLTRRHRTRWKYRLGASVLLALAISSCTSHESVKSSELPSHHRAEGGFRNPPGSPVREIGAGAMARFLLGQLFIVEPPPVPEDHRLSVEEFHQRMDSATNPSVTWLGHSAFIIRIGSRIILTDPFLGEVAGPFGIGPSRYVAPPLLGPDLPKADVMLISHDHYDHLDAETIESYPHKHHTWVVVPLGLGRFFTERGYAQVVEQDWWESWQLEELKVTTLPAIHSSGRWLTDRDATLWASFGIRGSNLSLWFSGDTAAGPVFEEIGARAGPFDVALVAIGAYEPRSIMQAVHVNPEEAVEIANAVRARHAIGMHWGTIMLTPENPFDAPDRFQRAARDQGYGAENVSTMKIGETRTIR